MERIVASEEIAAWLPLCERIARRYNGLGGAEYDDLRQEGMIAVWIMLQHGYWPNKIDVENRVKNWINVCRRRGFTGDET